jgi:hypothetical protein
MVLGTRLMSGGNRTQRHGATGGDDRRREQRRDVPGAERSAGDRCTTERATAPDRSTTTGSRHRAWSAAPDRRRAARGAAAGTDQLHDHGSRSDGRHECREALAQRADVTAELAAGLAVAKMPTCRAGRADAAVVALDELPADLHAGRVPSLSGPHQADAGAHQE